jgi:hypothetical protein
MVRMSEDTISTNNCSRSRVDSSWQDPDRAHELVKTEDGWKCQCCDRSWLKKPRSKCLGLPVVPGAVKVVNWQDAISIDTALRSNLQLKQSTKPIAARRDPLGDPNCDLFYWAVLVALSIHRVFRLECPWSVIVLIFIREPIVFSKI